MFFALEYRQTFIARRTSSWKFTLDRRGLFVLVFAIGLLGGNQSANKHRMVPPFLYQFFIMNKSFICVVVLLLVTIFGHAQSSVDFKLQSDATFKTTDGKEYVVIQKEGKTASELYNEILNSVTLLYNSPKDVVSKVENNTISINGISSDCVTLSGMLGVKVSFSIQYILQFQFKDGRIRVEAPKLSRVFTGTTDVRPISGWLKTQNIFKKDKPNPKKQSTIDDFENTLNGLINRILTSKKVEEDW